MPAKKKHPNIVAVPSPPLVQPTIASLSLTISFAVLPLEIISPASINNGIAKRAQLSMELKGTSPKTLKEYTSQSKIKPRDPSAKTMNKGTPIAKFSSINAITITTIRLFVSINDFYFLRLV